MDSSDAVITISHQPRWVLDYDYNLRADQLPERNVRELMSSHLAGKVRARLAGDLHHYTRHVPIAIPNRPRKRSLSFDEGKLGVDTKSRDFEPFVEGNKPELIVSGGGGAFLHGTSKFTFLFIQDY